MLNIPAGLSDEERGIYKVCFTACEKLINEGKTIAEAVDAAIAKYSFLISDINELRGFLYAEITVYSEPTVALIAEKYKNSDWWSKRKADYSFPKEYSERYYDYMCNKPSWGITAIDELNRSTDKTMNAIVDPQLGAEDERIGMIFGYVQSGKTAHYISLINKAYDAGYKIIIVLTGMHDSLRSQTQSRIDEEVLGYETSIDYFLNSALEKNAIGVGVGFQNQIRALPMLQSLTTRDQKGDFSKSTLGVKMTNPFIIVTKKNAVVLRNILKYFNNAPFAETENGKKYIPATYPALIIDDEADQASVNTKAVREKDGSYKKDYDPSTINGLIRKLLRVFKTRSYVGYTATPYANIFIDPKTPDTEYGSDLYPRDFIFRAPRSNMYVGAREFFGLAGAEDAPTMPLFRPIIKGASYLGKGTKVDDPVGPIPDDLKLAVRYFYISTALRNLRGQINKPNSMLVHVVRFVGQQNIIKRKVQDYRDELESYIRYNDMETCEEFHRIWNSDYLPTHSDLQSSFPRYMDGCTMPEWTDIWNEICRIVQDKEITVYAVNGKSLDALIYKNHQGRPFNVIVIGGDKLSRGLTLEGLTVSYFTRSSSTYDTLMQMGRWFGFRPGYLDACRLFTTKDLFANFSHISMATEDLASQFDFMDEVSQTPRDFGLRVATHPTLLITARNKLRTGIEMKSDFSCKLSQTRVFDVDGETYDHNFEAVESLLKAIGTPLSKQGFKDHFHKNNPGDHYFWINISGYHIASFFEAYQTSKSATRANSKYMAEYVREMMKVGGVTDWTVCLMNFKREDKPTFSIAGFDEIGAGIFRAEGKGVQSQGSTVSIHTMTSEGHEFYDFTAEQLRRKDAREAELKAQKKNDKRCSEILRSEIRDQKQGFLILYPIADAGDLTKMKGDHKTPFGFAVVFPDRKGKGDLKTYRMNDVAVENDSDEFYD